MYEINQTKGSWVIATILKKLNIQLQRPVQLKKIMQIQNTKHNYNNLSYMKKIPSWKNYGNLVPCTIIYFVHQCMNSIGNHKLTKSKNIMSIRIYLYHGFLVFDLIRHLSHYTQIFSNNTSTISRRQDWQN